MFLSVHTGTGRVRSVPGLSACEGRTTGATRPCERGHSLLWPGADVARRRRGLAQTWPATQACKVNVFHFFFLI